MEDGGLFHHLQTTVTRRECEEEGEKLTHCGVTRDDYLVSSQDSCDGTCNRWLRFSDPDPGDHAILDSDPDGGFPPDIGQLRWSSMWRFNIDSC